MNLEDSDECRLAFKEKLTKKFQKELDISKLPEVRYLGYIWGGHEITAKPRSISKMDIETNFQMLEIENMEMALTILSIFMFEASSFHNQTSKSQKFLKEKNIDIVKYKKKLGDKWLN